MDSPRIKGTGVDHSSVLSDLAEAIRLGKEWTVDHLYIEQAENLYHKFEISQELQTSLRVIQASLPITKQSVYMELIYPLEALIKQAEACSLEKSQIQAAEEIISRVQVEYWLVTLTHRLDVVKDGAQDCHEHDINRLKLAIQKAQAFRVADDLLDVAMRLHQRLSKELLMTRAIAHLPVVKLPMENPPDGYWNPEEDVGKIVETPEYPLPPADTGEYQWQSSKALTNLRQAYQALKEAWQGAEEVGAHPGVVAESKEKIVKAEKDMKLLEVKDGQDKVLAVEAATKLAKKLKKGKGKKK